jgi:hypothetical protein
MDSDSTCTSKGENLWGDGAPGCRDELIACSRAALTLGRVWRHGNVLDACERELCTSRLARQAELSVRWAAGIAQARAFMAPTQQQEARDCKLLRAFARANPSFQGDALRLPAYVLERGSFHGMARGGLRRTPPLLAPPPCRRIDRRATRRLFEGTNPFFVTTTGSMEKRAAPSLGASARVQGCPGRHTRHTADLPRGHLRPGSSPRARTKRVSWGGFAPSGPQWGLALAKRPQTPAL